MTAVEAQKVPGIGKVIEDHDTKFDIEDETSFWIQATHGGMCKFASKADNGYRKISGAIKEQIEDASQWLEERSSNVLSGQQGISVANAVSPLQQTPNPQPLEISSLSNGGPGSPPPYFAGPDSPTSAATFALRELSSTLPVADDRPKLSTKDNELLTLFQYKRMFNIAISIEGSNPPERYHSAIEGYKYLKTWNSSPETFRGVLERDHFNPRSKEALGDYLFLAAYAGDEDAAHAALCAGADPNHFLKLLNECPLHGALTFGHAAIVKSLLQNGASLLQFLNGVSDAQNEQELFRNYLRVVNPTTIQTYVQYCGKDSLPSDAVLAVAERSMPGVMDLLFRHEFDLTIKGPQGTTALHIAVRHNQKHVVEYLINLGFPVDVLDEFEQTPLYDAIIGLKIGMSELLAQHNAAVNLKDKSGNAPIHVLIRQPTDADGDPLNSDEIENMKFSMLVDLQKRGASLEAQDAKGNRPLHLAISTKQGFLAAVLIYLGSDPNAVDADGWTPLHLCAAGGGSNPGIAQFLIEAGASLKSRLPAAQHRLTPLDVAKRLASAQMVQLYKSGKRERGLNKFLARRGIVM